jgi:branched-chain amino acid transport system substrate-binding protein
MRSKFVVYFLMCAFIIGSLINFSCKKNLPPKDKIIIGQAVSLTGSLAMQNAVISAPYYELWRRDVNSKGGIFVKEYNKKLPVEFLIYDDKSDIGEMARLLEKLILEEKVDFLLPPVSTDMLFTAAAIANKHQYIMISGAGGAMKLKDVGLPYFFQSLNFAETQVPALAEIIKELGVKKVAIVYAENLHGIENEEVADQLFVENGLDVVLSKSYQTGVNDFTPLIRQAQNLEADAFCGFSYPDECSLITKQAKMLNYNPKIFFLSVGPAFSFYKYAFGNKLIEGIMGGGAWNQKISPDARKFADHYKEVYGEEIGNYWGSIFFYSAMQHFTQAVEEAGTLDQRKIRDIMAKAEFNTTLGPFRYDKRGIFVNHPGQIGQWQKGIFEVIDPGEKRTAKPIVKPKW